MSLKTTIGLGHKQIAGDRAYQEDSFGYLLPGDTRDHYLIALADGMGGHVGGAEASRIAVNAALRSLDADMVLVERLEQAWQSANDNIANHVQGNPDLEGMGCTLVGVVVDSNGLSWVSIGDSPLWLYRDGTLRRVNKDHSMVPVLEALVAAGELTSDEAASDRRRNSLRSALMGDDVPLVDVCDQPMELIPGDRLILASDGLDTLSNKEISTLMDSAPDGSPSQLIAESLVDAVAQVAKPNQDNTTVITMTVLNGVKGLDEDGTIIMARRN